MRSWAVRYAWRDWERPQMTSQDKWWPDRNSSRYHLKCTSVTLESDQQLTPTQSDIKYRMSPLSRIWTWQLYRAESRHPLRHAMIVAVLLGTVKEHHTLYAYFSQGLPMPESTLTEYIMSSRKYRFAVP